MAITVLVLFAEHHVLSAHRATVRRQSAVAQSAGRDAAGLCAAGGSTTGRPSEQCRYFGCGMFRRRVANALLAADLPDLLLKMVNMRSKSLDMLQNRL